VHLVGRQDHVLAGETTTWLERTDARVGTSTDGTVRSLGRYAGETCLWSKQELLRRKGFGWALTVEGAPKAFYIAGCSYDALVGLRQ